MDGYHREQLEIRKAMRSPGTFVDDSYECHEHKKKTTREELLW